MDTLYEILTVEEAARAISHERPLTKIDLNKGTLKVRDKFVIKDGLVMEGVIPDGVSLIPEITDFYAEVERLYSIYKTSVPSRYSQTGYFKALSADELTEWQMEDNPYREETQVALELYVLLAKVTGAVEWKNEKHYFWQSENDKDLVIYKDWVIGKD